jgi:putative transposase
MTDDRLPLADLMAKTGDGDFLRSVAESVLQIIMEADVDGIVGADRHERSGDRSTWRNGYGDRSLDTRLGTLNLKIPKLRTGAYFPGFLEPRKTAKKALVSVIQEAWIAGVITRRVDELVQAMGMSGISKSSVSKLCKDIDEPVNAFLKRPLAGEWPYLWLDATSLKVREGSRIVSVAAIIAVAVTTEGKREIVGLHVGPSEAEPFWSTFLRDLVRRGLKGVKLVISDAHGQAVDFVPVAGVNSITRDQIRALMGQSGIRLIELLGLDDRGHAYHWHVAFVRPGQVIERRSNPVARTDVVLR